MDKLKGLSKLPAEWKKCETTLERKMFAKQAWADYKTVFLYIIFGGGTTLVNIVVYALCYHLFDLGTIISNCLAWFFAVLFAYLTNRSLVFNSQHHTPKSIAIEVFNFFLARGATGLLDLGIMFVSVDLLGWPDVLMKVISNIIVIILNFVASKLWIFSGTDKKPKAKKTQQKS